MAEKQKDGSQRTLGTALLLSAPGPLVTGFSAITSGSATQLADFLRRTAELVATLVSYVVYRRRGELGQDEAARQKLERSAALTVAGAMMLSGLALLVVGMVRLFNEGSSGRPITGLVIGVLGLLVNGTFWLRYRKINRAEPDVIIANQEGLYRAKVIVDSVVTIALAAVVFAPTHPATRYIDALGSIAVAGYLLFKGVQGLLKNKPTE